MLLSLSDYVSLMLHSNLLPCTISTFEFDFESNLSHFSNQSYSALSTDQPPTIRNNTSSFSILVANFRSVKYKQAELQAFLASSKVDIILGTESHLDDSIANSEIFHGPYQIYHKDRNIYGGGVFILLNNNIPSSQVMINSLCEAVWVQIHTGDHTSMILGSFYCPPQSLVSIWDDLVSLVGQLKHQFPDSVLLLGGDFNCPGIDSLTINLT